MIGFVKVKVAGLRERTGLNYWTFGEVNFSELIYLIIKSSSGASPF